ncbi:MAG: FHA domain-containing protein [Phycisphaerae bacterium]
MFSRWINVRRKAAEAALRDGRLDEAFERLSSPEALNDGSNKELLNELARTIASRARLHAQAGRYREAIADLEKLAKIGRVDNEAADFRQRIDAEWRHRVERHQERHDAFARAAGDLRDGRLDSAHVAIERIEDARQREQLREELDIRRQRASSILEQAQKALSAGDLAAACRAWQEAVTRHGRSAESDALAGEIMPRYRKTLEEWIHAGALERFQAILSATRGLREFDPAGRELESCAKWLTRAAEALRGRDYDGIREALLRVRAAQPEAAWLGEALSLVAQITSAQERLLSCPLGLLSGESAAAANVGERPHAAQFATARADKDAAMLNGRPLLLLVDGTGSSLLVREDVVRIGRVGGNVEVPIPGDIQSLHAEIAREDQDYFLVAHGPLRVNHVAMQRALLRDGDRLTLSGRVKLTFHKPSVRSSSAVLRMSDRCRLPQDVSSVVLFRDTCLLGPSASCHLQTREGDTRLVLFERGGQLMARRQSGDNQAYPLALDQTREIGDLRITIKYYEASPAAGLA